MYDEFYQALNAEVSKVQDAVVGVHILLPKAMSLGSSIRTISQAYSAQRNQVWLVPCRTM